jgi:putative flippase GtrA
LSELGGNVAGHRARLNDLFMAAPAPLRFLSVGAIGLSVDMASFTLLALFGMHPLVARALSLSLATFVTWRLNRAVTFAESGRRPHAEAVRYAIVTAFAQGLSYLTFAVLVMTVLKSLPQAAILIGAALATFASYNGHRLFSFAAARSRGGDGDTGS